mmetsp:Transcript_116018/g.315002  ORF Transcript_116018/g.315002 Transcript_116018/m.315002 type:complete len:119 (+) Transcript_116018:1-357(+)
MVDVNAGFEAMGNPNSLYAADELHLSAEGYSHWDHWVGLALGDSACALWLSGACVLSVGAPACSALDPDGGWANRCTKKCPNRRGQCHPKCGLKCSSACSCNSGRRLNSSAHATDLLV